MLFSSQQENQTTRTVLPASFELKPFPHFAAEFLTDNPHRVVRSIEVPMQNSPAFDALRVEETQQACRITDTCLRVEKLRRFAQDCSWAIDHVYFGGEGVARDRQKLGNHGITHVVNCVGLEVGNFFDEELTYLGLFLQDSGEEDILAVLYDVFDFIEEAKRCNGNVFVHCSQVR